MTISGRTEAQSFGYWLRLKRKSLDLTRAGLAERVGCSVGTIQKLEEEERRPSAQIVERLADVFNIPPGDRSTFLQFARGDLRYAISERDENFPWRKGAKRPHANLPTTVTSLVGRTKEIAEVRDRLSRAEIHLITLTGPPGIGKTRLSIETARIALPSFPDGVFFAALAPLDDGGLIAGTVAQTMGYVGTRNISTLEQLKEGIGDKRVLLVLDNCEHLIEDVASFAAFLLSACPHLKILATSRESLRIPGEWLYSVPALVVPDENSPVAMEDVSEFPALALFAERARAVQPDFELNVENIKTISSICARLDGLPLAIELIAARTRLIPPQPLLERLHDPFMLSADGLRAVAPRQKSLNNAIDWSFQLLSEEEQKLFAYLSIFRGEFALNAAETIFSQAFPSRNIADLMTSLLDKSLLQRSFDSSQEPRYVMLVTIQGFARQRLQNTDQESELRNWHLAYYLGLATQADAGLRGKHQPEWLNRLHAEGDNVRAALDWGIKTGQTQATLELAQRLWWYWSMRSEFNEGRQWLKRVLALPDAPLYPAFYSQILTQLAHHTCLQMGGEEARPFIEQALTIARAHGSPESLANGLLVRGIVMAYEGKPEAAQPTLEESATLFRTIGDPWGQALAIMSLCYSANKTNDLARALSFNEQALTTFRELGDLYFQSVCLYELGSLRAKQGDWGGGLAALRESLAFSRELGSKYESAAGLLRLAEIERQMGRLSRAVKLYRAASNLYRSIGAWQQEDDHMLEKQLAPIRTLSSDVEFTTAIEEGSAMTMEQAISYALDSSLDR